jgi:hypothetical protein
MMEIENPNSTSLSPTSIKRILIKNGLKARRRPKKWLISEINKIKRVKWCKVMRNLIKRIGRKWFSPMNAGSIMGFHPYMQVAGKKRS